MCYCKNKKKKCRCKFIKRFYDIFICLLFIKKNICGFCVMLFEI